jgi:hypothetical protein
MAWPASPLANFSDNNSPPCNASFLNNLQTGVNQLTLGTTSHAAVVIDGTGGIASTPVTGAIKVSATALQTSIPTPAPVLGTVYKDLAIFAAVTFNGSGGGVSIAHAYNIQSAVRNSAGNYTFTYVTNPASTPIIADSSPVAGFRTVLSGASTFTVTTSNTSNTATDYNSPVSVIMIGGF